MMRSIQRYLDNAVNAALQAGQESQKLMRNADQCRPDWKASSDFSTRIDRKIERMIMYSLEQSSDVHTFLAEESSDADMPIPEGLLWVIDPIDGTIPMVMGKEYGILIGLVNDNKPLIGVMYFPKSDSLFAGDCHSFSRYDIGGKRLVKGDACSSHESKLEHSKIAYESGKGQARRMILPYLDDLCMNDVNALLTQCCISNSIHDLLAGKIDGVIGIGQKPWDVAPILPICGPAGLKVACLDGSGFDVTKDNVLVSVPRIYQSLLNITKPIYEDSH